MIAFWCIVAFVSIYTIMDAKKKVAEKNINILATRGLVFTNAVKHKRSKK